MTNQRLVIQGRVIVALFFSYLLSNASLQVAGTYMPALEDEFNVGPAALGWICSSGYAITCLLGPIAGIIINKVESRWVVMAGGFFQSIGLMLMYPATSLTMLSIGGFMSGIGGSLVYVSGPIKVARHFNSFYTTAIGVALSGIGAGIVSLPPLIETLITVYVWRGAALIHGAFVFHIVALGALLPLDKCSKTSTKLKHTDSQYRQIDQNTDYANHEKEGKIVEASDERSTTKSETKWYLTYIQLFTSSPSMGLVYIAAFLFNSAYCSAITHIYNQIIMTGYSSRQGVWAFSLLGVGSILGRLLHVIPIDAGIMLPSTLYEIALFVAGAVTFINPLANNYIGFIVSAAGLGFLSGIMFPLIYTIMKRKVGTSLLAPAVGLELFIDGLGVTSGGYLSGAIEELSGDYRLSFVTIGAAFLLASCIFFPVCVTERKVKHGCLYLLRRRKQIRQRLCRGCVCESET